jgi:hypothetical protein
VPLVPKKEGLGIAPFSLLTSPILGGTIEAAPKAPIVVPPRRADGWPTRAAPLGVTHAEAGEGPPFHRNRKTLAELPSATQAPSAPAAISSPFFNALEITNDDFPVVGSTRETVFAPVAQTSPPPKAMLVARMSFVRRLRRRFRPGSNATSSAKNSLPDVGVAIQTWPAPNARSVPPANERRWTTLRAWASTRMRMPPRRLPRLVVNAQIEPAPAASCAVPGCPGRTMTLTIRLRRGSS